MGNKYNFYVFNFLSNIFRHSPFYYFFEKYSAIFYPYTVYIVSPSKFSLKDKSRAKERSSLETNVHCSGFSFKLIQFSIRFAFFAWTLNHVPTQARYERKSTPSSITTATKHSPNKFFGWIIIVNRNWIFSQTISWVNWRGDGIELNLGVLLWHYCHK